MRGFVRLMAVVVTAAVFVVACSKDKDSGKITLDSPAVFFAQAGGSATVGFTAQNIKTLSATSKPTGWDEAVVDLAGATISVKAPSAEDIESGDAVKTGSFSFTGYTPGGTLVSATLFAGIVTTKDISAEVANSYIVTEPETNYLIDATRKGDGSQLATSYVNVVWQTASGFVQYADFEDGKASFYIGADSDDATKIKQGNAVIGAYDADGELIWSWHIWATDYDPDAEGGTVDFNGYTLMNRNLGALANDNSTTDKILASYGLYYQWGRKDPFIGPNTYQGSEGSGASMYSGSGPLPYSSRSSDHISILPLSDCGCAGITLPSGVFVPGKRYTVPILLPRYMVLKPGRKSLVLRMKPVSYFGAPFTVAISTPVTLMRSRNSSKLAQLNCGGSISGPFTM